MKVTPQQALAIFSLVFGRTHEERRPSFSAFTAQTGITASARGQLEKAKLLESKKVGTSSYVSLTDEGWRWAAENLASPLSQSKNATRILEGALHHLRPFLEKHRATLAELAPELPAAEPQAPSAAPKKTAKPKKQGAAQTKTSAAKARKPAPSGNAKSAGDLAGRVIAAALEIGGGPKHRVRLADVRSKLADVPREQIDHVLMELQGQERLVLYRIDDPSDVRPEDKRAALMIAGNPRHILYLEA